MLCDIDSLTARTKEITLTPTNKRVENFYVHVNFAGLYGYEDPQDPIYENIRMVSTISFFKCPLLCASKV